MKLSELRKIIREEVERNMRWSAGLFGGGGISKSNAGVVEPPPGLGDENVEEKERDEEEEERFSQLGARARRQD